MTSKAVIAIAAKTIIVCAIISIVIGTALWLAIDIASFYTENQFTGKMKAYDAHLINCIGAAFVMTLSTVICKALGKLIDLEK
jgi:uncharacterized membrane protein YdcZ (DUF606 family)